MSDTTPLRHALERLSETPTVFDVHYLDEVKRVAEWALNALDAAEEMSAENKRLLAEVERLRALLQRIRQWDMLRTAADGAFWKREIDAHLRRASDE